jgi:hypothetical protein
MLSVVCYIQSENTRMEKRRLTYLLFAYYVRNPNTTFYFAHTSCPCAKKIPAVLREFNCPERGEFLLEQLSLCIIAQIPEHDLLRNATRSKIFPIGTKCQPVRIGLISARGDARARGDRLGANSRIRGKDATWADTRGGLAKLRRDLEGVCASVADVAVCSSGFRLLFHMRV